MKDQLKSTIPGPAVVIQSPTGGRQWLENQDFLFPDGLVYRCLGSTFVIQSIPCASVCGPSAYISFTSSSLLVFTGTSLGKKRHLITQKTLCEYHTSCFLVI